MRSTLLIFYFMLLCRCLARLSNRSYSYSLCSKNFEAKANFNTTVAVMSANYSVEQRGALYSDTFRLFFKNENGQVISPMHDISLSSDVDSGIFNMVVEIPRWSNAKMEINLKEKMNPIKQDVKKGNVRFVANCFPHKGYIWNYGAIPQTWEDPNHVDDSTKCKGDGDPIDVCEIGQKIHKRGAVIQVKVLGAVAMIDEGETDWKILAIDITDPLADLLNDVQDIETNMPGFLAAAIEWFKIYKMPEGKPANKFAFNERPQNKSFAINIIKECNQQFIKMMSANTDPEEISRACTIYDSAMKISGSDAASIVASMDEKKEDCLLDSVIDKWHYVKA